MDEAPRLDVSGYLADALRWLFEGGHGLAAALSDLTIEELHHRPSPESSSIGFDAWHVARTVDDVVNFVLLREPTVWREQQLAEAWALPRNSQGTGMTTEEAAALRFPEPRLLARYALDVSASVAPKIERMTDDFLAGEVEMRGLGMRTRLYVINTIALIQSSNHLGQIAHARTLLGKPGLGM
jgi:hypothetical protein